MNGWTNWDTWNAYQHLDNADENMSDDFNSCKSAQEVKDLWESTFPNSTDGIDVDEVNFKELYESTDFYIQVESGNLVTAIKWYEESIEMHYLDHVDTRLNLQELTEEGVVVQLIDEDGDEYDETWAYDHELLTDLDLDVVLLDSVIEYIRTH